MEVDYSNVIIKCLGKALNSKIKFICSGNVKFYDSSSKDITSRVTKERLGDIRKPCSVYICLGKKYIFFLKSDLRSIYECLSYENLLPLELDKKNLDLIHIGINSSKQMKNPDIAKISVNMKNRKVLLNNLLCYYTIYYEYKYQMIKSLAYKDESENKEQKKKENKGTKFHEQIIKNYSFYLKGIIKKNKSSPGYHITYLVDKKKGDKGEKEYFSEECDLIVDIFEQAPLCKFDHNINNKDLSYFAYTNALSFLKNNLKCGNFWILKNEVFTKKINLNEDMSLWEGWTIEARVCEPEYKNVVFVFLRRKYIPPYFDTYQDFILVLNENSSFENYEINPEAYNVIYLAANSLSTPIISTVKENQLFLSAKIDSLLVDEDTLYFYQSVYGIYGEDIFTFGYELLNSLLSYFEKTNVAEKIENLKPVVEAKKKKWSLSCHKWDCGTRTYEFLNKIKQYIIDITNDKKEGDTVDPNSTPLIQSSPYGTTQGEKLPSTKMAKMKNKFLSIWTKKVMRFVGFVLNGGLTDYKMTYSQFLKDVLGICNNTNHDINELCYFTINLRDLSQKQYRKEMFQPKSIIHSLSSNSAISYNSSPMDYCISSNFLQKYLDKGGNNFIANLLVNHCSNTLLRAIYENLKNADNPNMINEKKDLISLIYPLNQIFSDHRQNPTTLLLVCKSLCLLVNSNKKGEDETRRIALSESNILKTISIYLDEYDYDQQLMLCCLDLFNYVSKETFAIKELLFNHKGNGLMDKFLKFLKRPKIPGVYYSQRLMIKILTILLSLTGNIRAEMREMMNTMGYQKIYKLVVDLLVDETRKEIIDPSEEESSILEFKIFYLIIVLTSGKVIIQNYIFSTFDFDSIIENCSEKYLKQMKALVALGDRASQSEKSTIGKKVYKFMEMVYYFLVKNEDRTKDVYQKSKKFIELKTFCDNKISTILNEDDLKSDVLNMIEKLFMKLREELAF